MWHPRRRCELSVACHPPAGHLADHFVHTEEKRSAPRTTLLASPHTASGTSTLTASAFAIVMPV